MSPERALQDVCRQFCARDQHDDACIALRAEHDRAKALVAQAKALCDEAEMIWPDAPEWAVDGVRQFTDRMLAVLTEGAR